MPAPLDFSTNLSHTQGGRQKAVDQPWSNQQIHRARFPLIAHSRA